MDNGIIRELKNMADGEYREFHLKLTPGVDPGCVLGVRTPELRQFARKLIKENNTDEFLSSLPHYYFDENRLHAFIISEIKDFYECIRRVEEFLPYVDNWAVCDQMLPKCFGKHRDKLPPYAVKWIDSGETYTSRFGIGVLMNHFLDDLFDVSYAVKVAGIKSDEYYVNMMRAWYFATALAKQYDKTLPFIEEKKLDVFTHNKAIQTSLESFRVSQDRKDYLRTLKIR